MLLVLLEALLEGGVEGAFGGLANRHRPHPGHELQHGGAGILPRQHEATGLDQVQSQLLFAGMQIVGVALGELGHRPLLEALIRLPLRCQPAGGNGLQLGATQLLAHLLAPLLVAHLKQRQVEQPLPGVVHQIHVEGGDLPQMLAQRMAGAIANFEAHFGHPAGRFGPGRRIAKQGVEAALVGKGGNVGILLGHPAGTEDTPLAQGIPQGKAAVDGRVFQLVDQRRDEGRLAAAREAGDRQPDVAIPYPVDHIVRLVLQAIELLFQFIEYQGLSCSPVHPERRGWPLPPPRRGPLARRPPSKAGPHRRDHRAAQGYKLRNSRCRVNSLEVTSFSMRCNLGSSPSSSWPMRARA